MYVLLWWLPSLLVQAATWLFLLGFGVWLYRRFRLRSLPWLGAYVLLAMPLDLVASRLTPTVIFRLMSAGWNKYFVAVWVYGAMTLRSLSGLLLAVIVVAEISALLARLSPGPEQRALRLMQVVRERSVPLGLALLGLSLAEPLVVAILWLVEPAATVVRTAAG